MSGLGEDASHRSQHRKTQPPALFAFFALRLHPMSPRSLCVAPMAAEVGRNRTKLPGDSNGTLKRAMHRVDAHPILGGRGPPPLMTDRTHNQTLLSRNTTRVA